jgi:hypothetical protein
MGKPPWGAKTQQVIVVMDINDRGERPMLMLERNLPGMPLA